LPWSGAQRALTVATPIHNALDKAPSAARVRGLVVMQSTSSRDNTTLEVEGEENITIYRAHIQNPEDVTAPAIWH
jgi:hypothetical protein